jgi:NIMA (never in mitosis gene a)-related kinase
MGMSQDQQEEVLNEARILAALDHPSIIKLYTSFKSEGYINILMEYADGGDLHTLIRSARGSHFPEPQIVGWLSQICLALQHIHDRKVIHRDLKTHNLFTTRSGAIKLGDFGIAKHLEGTLQARKTVVGTPYYMSPEICENRDYSFKTDIWSLGIVLYELCQLKLPFEASSLPLLALKISRGEYPAVTAHYSKELKTLIKNLLQNAPEKRPSLAKILRTGTVARWVAEEGQGK